MASGVLQSKNKFIIPRKLSKSVGNVDYLIRLGVPLNKAMTICGYSKSEEETLRGKLSVAMAASGLNYPEESAGDEEVTIDVTVDNSGMIRRKYDE